MRFFLRHPLHAASTKRSSLLTEAAHDAGRPKQRRTNMQYAKTIVWFTFTIYTSGFFFLIVRKRIVFCNPTRRSFLGAEMQRKAAAFPDSAATAVVRQLLCFVAYRPGKQSGLTRTYSKDRPRFLHPRSPCFYALFGCLPVLYQVEKPLMWRSRRFVCLFLTTYQPLNSPSDFHETL